MATSEKSITIEIRQTNGQVARETLVSRMKDNVVRVYYQGRWLRPRLDKQTLYLKA